MGWLLAVGWLASIVLAHSIVQFPLSVSGWSLPGEFVSSSVEPITIGRALGQAALDTVAVAALVALGGALGAWALRDLTRLDKLERAAAQALLGLAAMSLLGLGLGLVGLYPPRWLAWAGLAALLALLRLRLLVWWGDLRAGLAEALGTELDGFTRWVRRGVLALLALTVAVSLAPPTKWDALTYHLVIPQTYLEAGRIVSVPQNHFFGFPQLVETLYLWLMILARPHAAALLHGVFGALLLIAVLGLARRVGRPAAGWLACAALLVSNSIWAEFHWPYNDLALMAYTFAALAMLLAWREAPSGERRRLLVLAGIFTGCMMATKYTAAGFTLGIGAVALWLARAEGARRAVQTAATVALVALAAFAPTMLKNLLIDGNPFSPFVWGTAGYDTLDQWYYLRPGTGVAWPGLLAVPLQLTVFGREDAAPFGASAGALTLGLLPFAAVRWCERNGAERQAIGALLVFAVPAFLAWLGGAATSYFLMQTRLLFPLFPALAISGALGLEGLQHRAGQGFRVLGQAVVGVALALAVVAGMLDAVNSGALGSSSGVPSEDDYLLGKLGAYYAAMLAVNRLDEDALVLFLFEPRTYYCVDRCIPDSLLNRWWHARQLERNPLRIASGWTAEGVTHVLVFEDGMRFLIDEEPSQPLTAEDVAALDLLRGTALVPVWDALDSYTLYELQEVAR